MKFSRQALARISRIRRTIVREKLSPEAIAAGWALGMFIGCSIPFGFQLIVSIPLAIRFRISKVGATLGTFITNPLTIIFIYPAQTFAVDWLLFGGNLTFSRLENMEWSFASIMSLGWQAMASFLIGGLILALILTPPTYFAILRLVRSYRAHRANGNDKP